MTGRVEAKTLVIEGTVEGPALVADRLEIGSTARVRSSIQARVMAIADGAIFEGEVRMDEAGSPQSFTEKREGLDGRRGQVLSFDLRAGDVKIQDLTPS